MNSYGNDASMESEEKKRPFSSLPTLAWKARKMPRAFPISTASATIGDFFFFPIRLTSTWTKSVTYMPGTFCYRHAQPHRGSQTDKCGAINSRGQRDARSGFEIVSDVITLRVDVT